MKLENVNCNNCGSKKFKYLLTGKDLDFKVGDEYKVVKCMNCGLVFVNPRPSVKDINMFYPDNYGPHTTQEVGQGRVKDIIFNMWEIYKNFFSIDFVKNLPKGKILDVGCGSGNYLNALKKRGWDVCGIDLSPLAAKMTRKFGIKCYCGELHKAKIKQNYFDVVVAINSIEHMRDPLKNVRKINYILKNSGYLILVAPNIDSIETKIFGSNWHEWDIPRHLYHYSTVTLTALLTKSGFKVTSVDYESRIDGLLRSTELKIGTKGAYLVRVLAKIFYPFFALFEYKIGREFLVIRASKKNEIIIN